MKHLFMLIAVFAIASPLYLCAQSATIEFPGKYVASVVQIAPSAVAHNGTITPIAFTPTYRTEPKLGSIVVSSAAITVGAYRSLVVDLRGATTIVADHPNSTKGLLRADVELVDAATGSVLRRVAGLNTFMQNTKPGHDTSATRQLSIDLSDVQAKNVFLRFTSTDLCYSGPGTPSVSFAVTPSTEIEQVH